MKIKHPRCVRCARRWRGTPDWTAQLTEDYSGVNGIICPNCTTISEGAEALLRRELGQTFTAEITQEGRWWNKKPARPQRE